MKAKITLCKHPDENRYLMCWYNLQTTDFKFSFRASQFVPEELDKKLRGLHCISHSKSSLEAEVSSLLEPYIETIVLSYKETLLTASDEEWEAPFSEYSR